jgi:tetratricopeptide (TPR) repeat protein
MKRPFFKSGFQRTLITFYLVFSGVMLTFALLPTLAQGVQAARPAPAGSGSISSRNALSTRIAAAVVARDSGDPAAVQSANRLVAASALRELGDLRMIESSYRQAVESYRASLSLENTTSTQIELAIADIQAGQYDEAIQLAQQAHASEPRNLRADRAMASALVQSGRFVEAVAPFTRIATAEPEVDNLYPLAVCLLQTKAPGDKERAGAVFEQMKKIAGDSGSLHVLIGRAYRDADDMNSAVAEFQRAIQLDAKTPHAHYFLGLARLYMNDWKPTAEAEAQLRQETDNYPRDYLANYMLGFLTSGERRYDESNKYLRAAAEIDSSAPEPFLYLGLNAYSQDDMQSAEAMLRKAVDLTGSDEERSNYQIRRAYVDLGRILAKSGRTEESDAFVAKARDLQNKTMVQSQQSVASMAIAEGAGTAAAVMPLSRQVEIEAAPGAQNPIAIHSRLTPQQRAVTEQREKELRSILAEAFNDTATAEAIQRDYPHALEHYHQAEHWDSSFAGLAKNIGQCAFRLQDYPEAIRGLSKALAEDSNSAPLRGMLGISYFAIDRFAEAARTFEPLGTRGMQDGETGYAWAASLTHTGDMKRASEVLTVFEATPRPEDTVLLIGQLWTEIGDYVHATATLQRALDANPSLAKAHLYLGLVDIRSQHWPEAAKEFQSELNITPDDPTAKYHLGFVCLQQAKTGEAARLFREVVQAHPNYANAQYELGKILLDEGETREAVTHLEAAAHLSPDADYMHYQLQAAYRKEDRLAEADHELEIYKQIKAKSRGRAADAIKPTP